MPQFAPANESGFQLVLSRRDCWLIFGFHFLLDFISRSNRLRLGIQHSMSLR
jgi:hypothetical protein